MAASSHSSPHLPIPKQIHFVWVGGPIKEKYLKNLKPLLIAAKNSGFEVNFWTDNEKNIQLPAEESGIPNTYFKVKKIAELREPMRHDPFYSKGKYKKYWKLVDRELIGAKNLGAASDLLRYEILRQNGGYYFDTDTTFQFAEKIFPGDVQLLPDITTHGFLAAVLGIDSNNKITGLGNDILAAIPNHPILKNMIDGAILQCMNMDNHATYTDAIRGRRLASNEYKQSLMDLKRLLVNPDAKEDKVAYQHFRIKKIDRKNLTLAATGPKLLKSTIETYVEDEKIPCTELFFHSRHSDKYTMMGEQLIATSHSDLTWLPKNKLVISSFEDMELVKRKQPSAAEKHDTLYIRQLIEAKRAVLQVLNPPEAVSSSLFGEKSKLFVNIINATSFEELKDILKAEDKRDLHSLYQDVINQCLQIIEKNMPEEKKSTPSP